MKIEFKIQGIHCMGCVNLIKLTMEEHGFTDVAIDKNTDVCTAQFSGHSIEEAEKAVNKAFSEMTKYTIEGISQIE